MNTGSNTQVTKCHRCGRTLRCEASKRAGMGRWCRAKIRAAILAEAVRGFAERQVEKARELISDGGLLPIGRPGVFRAVSSDGERTYLTHPQTCSCPAAKRGRATPCYHSLAARIWVASRKVA